LIGFVGVLGTGLFVLRPHPASQDVTSSTETVDHGIGSVIVQSATEQCELIKFDNYSGRVVETGRHCENTVPVDTKDIRPLGTVRRLDAISKSFLK